MRIDLQSLQGLGFTASKRFELRGVWLVLSKLLQSRFLNLIATDRYRT